MKLRAERLQNDWQEPDPNTNIPDWKPVFQTGLPSNLLHLC